MHLAAKNESNREHLQSRGGAGDWCKIVGVPCNIALERFDNDGVHVVDIPGAEWHTILTEWCAVPPSHCKLLVMSCR